MLKKPLVLSLVLLGMGCGATEFRTSYPPAQDTMDRFLAGANRLGCSFKKNRVLGWSVGMRRAVVACPDKREVLIEADDRSTADAKHVTSIACSGPLGGNEAGCKQFVEELWNAGQ